jgi:hypothetical protein
MIALGLGYIVSYDLRNKLYVLGPAFIVIVLVLFYGIVTQIKSFSPTKVRRYAKRPMPVEELSRLLRAPSPAPAGEKLYKVFRNILCVKLGMPWGSTSEELSDGARNRAPQSYDGICEALGRYELIFTGRLKLSTETEFIDEYNKLMTVLISIDNKMWS